MLKYSLVMNSNKIKKKYNLKPKVKTSTMMISSLRAYKNKKKEINNNSEITSPIKMGVIRLLYYIF